MTKASFFKPFLDFSEQAQLLIELQRYLKGL